MSKIELFHEILGKADGYRRYAPIDVGPFFEGRQSDDFLENACFLMDTGRRGTQSENSSWDDEF
jgi:hypothetical protein